MTIGQKIKSFRESLGLGTDEFGDKIGVHFVGLQQIEDGDRLPDLELVYNIVRTFQVSPELFIEADSLNIMRNLAGSEFDQLCEMLEMIKSGSPEVASS